MKYLTKLVYEEKRFIWIHDSESSQSKIQNAPLVWNLMMAFLLAEFQSSIILYGKRQKVSMSLLANVAFYETTGLNHEGSILMTKSISKHHN